MALELKAKLFLLGFVVLCSAMVSQADPMLCSRLYKFGGPSAIFDSAECSFLKSIDRGTVNISCPAHSANGLRQYQNLSPCTLRVDMSLPGDKGTKEVEIMGSAVFRRNKGTEALEKACHLRVLMNYFSLQTHLLAKAKQFTGKLDDDSFYLRLIKEALIRTAEDAIAIFSTEANQRELASASRVAITLSVHGHILVANIGRPKTSVWSMKLLPWGEAKSCSYRLLLEKNRNREDPIAEVEALKFVESGGRTRLVFKELAKNHREDGRTWIQNAFDLILDSICRPRDIHPFKRFQSVEDSFHTSQGSTSSPNAVSKVLEIMASEDALASQRLGMYQVIEKTNMRDYCCLLWEEEANVDQKNSTAELLVSTAITRDYMGHLAAVVVPLQN